MALEPLIYTHDDCVVVHRGRRALNISDWSMNPAPDNAEYSFEIAALNIKVVKQSPKKKFVTVISAVTDL